LGLRSNRVFHPYLQFAFFKALKARKAFTFCDYLAKRAVTNSAYSALDVMLGGADARRLEYAEFAATWLVPPLAAKGGRIDDDQLLPDALPDFASDSMIQKDALPSCACASGTTVKEVPLGSVAGGVGVKLSAKPGSDPCNYAITLVAPTRDATMLVFDSTGAELGAAKPNAVVTLPSGTMDTFVSVAIDQGREQDGLGNEAAVRLSIRGEPAECGACCKVEGGRQFCARPEVGPWKFRSPNGTRTINCHPPYGDYYKIYDSEAEALSNIYAGADCQCDGTPPGCSCEVTKGPPGAWQVGPGNYILGVEEGANRQLPMVRKDDCGYPPYPLSFNVGDWLARWRDVACPAGYTPTSQ
jgi:hypothetical protein